MIASQMPSRLSTHTLCTFLPSLRVVDDMVYVATPSAYRINRGRVGKIFYLGLIASIWKEFAIAEETVEILLY